MVVRCNIFIRAEDILRDEGDEVKLVVLARVV
jgi:hypothetical protein